MEKYYSFYINGSQHYKVCDDEKSRQFIIQKIIDWFNQKGDEEFTDIYIRMYPEEVNNE